MLYLFVNYIITFNEKLNNSYILFILYKMHFNDYMKIPDYSELDTPKKRGLTYIKAHYPEFALYLSQKYPHINKFSGAIYLYYHHMDQPTCPQCGRPVPYLDDIRKFQTYCSLKCANRNPNKQNKSKKTCLERYGVTSAAQSKCIKQKIIATTIQRHGGMGNASMTTKMKQQQTMLNKYGVISALQNENILNNTINTLQNKYGGIGAGSPIIKEKIIKTNNIKYGVNSPLGNQDIRDKIQRTNIDKYGVPICSMSQQIIKKANHTKKLNRIAKNNDILDIRTNEDGNSICIMQCPHQECTKCILKKYEIPTNILYDRRRNHTELCTTLLPITEGKNYDTSIELFVKNILDQYNISYESKPNTSILDGKHIDIYCPQYKIGIECNGCYWHSTRNKDNIKYHYSKFLQCQDKNIQLLTIWQDQIIRIPQIIKSIILSKFGIYSQRIGARQCQVKIISTHDARIFLNENHLQGTTPSTIKLGLIYNDKIVALMTFGKRKSCQGAKNDKNWELLRYCSLLHTQIIGGADKLLKYFIKTYQPKTIISFSSNDISNGNLYKQLGFIKSNINLSYWYIDKLYKRYHRSNFTKAKIIKLKWNPLGNWKEADVMWLHGYTQIYDCGTTKWILNCK